MVYYLTMGNVQSDTFSTMSNDIRNLPKNHELAMHHSLPSNLHLSKGIVRR